MQDFLEASLKVELMGKTPKRMDENVSALSYFSGGSPAIVTTNMSYEHGDILLIPSKKLVKVTKVRDYENLVDIPDLVLDERVIHKIIEENRKNNRRGYRVLSLEEV